jgi:hypothetical protein
MEISKVQSPSAVHGFNRLRRFKSSIAFGGSKVKLAVGSWQSKKENLSVQKFKGSIAFGGPRVQLLSHVNIHHDESAFLCGLKYTCVMK